MIKAFSAENVSLSNFSYFFRTVSYLKKLNQVKTTPSSLSKLPPRFDKMRVFKYIVLSKNRRDSLKYPKLKSAYVKVIALLN